jgi:uncharacterized protein with PQ loop repeat
MAVLGLLAGGLITACVLPQLVAALRASDVSGVSVTGSTYAATSCAGWTLYATEVGLVEAAWSSAIGATLWSTIAVVVTVRAGRPPSAWVGLWAGSIVISASVIGTDGLGILLLFEAVTNTVPQALRVRRQTAGVSPPAFLAMGTGAACWAVYGLGTGNAPLAVSSAIKTATSVTIVGLLRPHRRPTPGRWWPGHARPPAGMSSSQPGSGRAETTRSQPLLCRGQCLVEPWRLRAVHGDVHLLDADGARHQDGRSSTSIRTGSSARSRRVVHG